MNREDIIRMAKNSGLFVELVLERDLDWLERFAALVASAERERIKQANAPEIERINAYIKESLAQPEFIKHEVKNADDWSEWVCPDPKNYLMKCCDCGLVHEAQFGVVRYKSETEREDCDMVDDPNLQAVFRMRRSEEWTPEDTAHRSGGLPMAQPEPVAWEQFYPDMGSPKLAYLSPTESPDNACYTPPQRTWVGLTEDEILLISADCAATHQHTDIHFARAIEAALKAKNT